MSLPQVAFLAYVAKKRVEDIEGVGTKTDFHTLSSHAKDLGVMPEATAAIFERSFVELESKRRQQEQEMRETVARRMIENVHNEKRPEGSKGNALDR